jgi:hypothetical protein
MKQEIANLWLIRSNFAISFTTLISALVALFIAFNFNRTKYKIESGHYFSLDDSEIGFYLVRIINKSSNKDLYLNKAAVSKKTEKGGLIIFPELSSMQFPAKISYGEFFDCKLNTEMCKTIVGKYNNDKHIFFYYYDRIGVKYKHKIKIKKLMNVIEDNKEPSQE